MNVFVDTSAFIALLVGNDQNHVNAVQILQSLKAREDSLSTSNYIVIETISLLQRRFGMAVARTFIESIVPLLQLEWIEPDIYADALVAFLIANRRHLSVVDCTSFLMMRRLGIPTAFTFDEHFEEQGFTCLP